MPLPANKETFMFSGLLFLCGVVEYPLMQPLVSPARWFKSLLFFFFLFFFFFFFFFFSQRTLRILPPYDRTSISRQVFHSTLDLEFSWFFTSLIFIASPPSLIQRVLGVLRREKFSFLSWSISEGMLCWDNADHPQKVCDQGN